MSSGYTAINSGPLIIRATSNPNYNTYAVGNNDVPIPSNHIVTTTANGMLAFTSSPYISSLYVSSINGLPYNPTTGDVIYNGNVYNINASTVTMNDNAASGSDNGGSSLPSGTCYSDYIYWDGTTWQTGGNISPTNVHLGCNAASTSQGLYAVAVGNSAGQAAQGSYSVALGYQAGQVSQGNTAVAIGPTAGRTLQGAASVAIGSNAGALSQGFYSVAIGLNAGQNLQNPYAVAIGYQAGALSQGQESVAIGQNAGYSNQATSAVAIGNGAGFGNQGDSAIAIGQYAGFYSQSINAVAIGNAAGNYLQGDYSVAIGIGSGESYQSENAVAIGQNAGQYSQKSYAVAIGDAAGQISQGPVGIAIGLQAAQYSQGDNAVAIGGHAGQNSQGQYAVAIGFNAGQNSQNANTIVLNATGAALDTGNDSAFYVAPIRSLKTNSTLYYDPSTKEITYGPDATTALGATNPIVPDGTTYGDSLYWDGSEWKVPTTTSVHVGANAGEVAQEVGAVAIGSFAGNANQNEYAIAIGQESGKDNQGTHAIALGFGAGYGNQGLGSIAAGGYAGLSGIGDYSIAVGYAAMQNSANPNTIMLNATGGALDASQDSAFYVAPIRSENTQSTLYYNPSTKEVTVGSLTSGAVIPNGAGYSDYLYWDGFSWTTPINSTIHVGVDSGKVGQGDHAVAIGTESGNFVQGGSAVAIGYQAGKYQQKGSAVAIGTRSGATNQSAQSIAIGTDAGYDSQQQYGIALGNAAGNINQGTYAIAMGFLTALTNQGTNAIAIGSNAGAADQGENAIAIGNNAGVNGQNPNTIILNATGNVLDASVSDATYIAPLRAVTTESTMYYNPDTNEVSYGDKPTAAVSAIPDGADYSDYLYWDGTDWKVPTNTAVHIGKQAGEVNQDAKGIAVGNLAGYNGQQENAIAIGNESGRAGQSQQAVALGFGAGYQQQGIASIAIGSYTGFIGGIGDYSIAIGHKAMRESSHPNSILLNATGASVNPSAPNSFNVKPVRPMETLSSLYYNSDTGEITYGSVPSGGSSSGTSDISYWNTTGSHIYSLNSGNVGIGTANPQNKLDVVGSASFTGTTAFTGNTFFTPSNPASSNSFRVELAGCNLNIYKSTINNNSTTFITNSGGYQLVLGTNNPAIFINGGAQGNNGVGIGVANPSERLAVNTTVLVKGDNNSGSRLFLGPSPNTGNYDYCSLIESVNYFNSHYGSDLRFYTHNTTSNSGVPTERIRITPLGNMSLFNYSGAPASSNSPVFSIEQPPGAYAPLIENYNHAFMIKDTNNKTNLFMGVDTATISATGSGYIQAVRNGSAKAPIALNPQGGNVAIGKTTPQSALDVEGTVTCPNISVSTINGVIPRLDITTIGSGSLTLPGPNTYHYRCEYTLIAGGGGGGGGHCQTSTENGSGGGGGGGGQVLTGTFYLFGGYNIDYLIGAGGIGGAANIDGTDGYISVLSYPWVNMTITAAKGNRGYSGASSNGGWGGSGAYGGGGAGPIGAWDVAGGTGSVANGTAGATGTYIGGRGGHGGSGGIGRIGTYTDEMGVVQNFTRGGGGGGGGIGGGYGGAIALSGNNQDLPAGHAIGFGAGGGGGYGGSRGHLSSAGGNAGGNGGQGCLTLVFTLISKYTPFTTITRSLTPLIYSISATQQTIYVPKNTISMTLELIGSAGLNGATATPVAMGGYGGYIYCEVLSTKIKELRGKNLVLFAGNNYSVASYIKIDGGNTLAIAGAGGSAGLLANNALNYDKNNRQGSGGNGGGLNGSFDGNVGQSYGIHVLTINGVQQHVIIGSDGTDGVYGVFSSQKIGGGGKKGEHLIGGAGGIGVAPNGQTTINGEAGTNVSLTTATVGAGGDMVLLSWIGATGKGGQGYSGGGSGAGAYDPGNSNATIVVGGGGGGASYLNTSVLNVNTLVSYGKLGNIPADRLPNSGRPTGSASVAYGAIRVSLNVAC